MRKIRVWHILLFMVLCFCSCAHKSGHKKNERESVRTSQVQERTEESRDYCNTERSSKYSSKKRKSNGEVLTGAEIFRTYNDAVFMIYTSDGRGICQGSGFFVGPNGLAVSNYHVFDGSVLGAWIVKLPGDDENFYEISELLHRDEDEDFIIFRVKDIRTNNYIPVAERRPNIGDRVYAIGSPQGLENTFSSGEVSQWRSQHLMQISAQIDHGSSGGALLNEYGEVVGITSGTFAEGSQANLNYAWSIEAVKGCLK